MEWMGVTCRHGGSSGSSSGSGHGDGRCRIDGHRYAAIILVIVTVAMVGGAADATRTSATVVGATTAASGIGATAGSVGGGSVGFFRNEHWNVGTGWVSGAARRCVRVRVRFVIGFRRRRARRCRYYLQVALDTMEVSLRLN